MRLVDARKYLRKAALVLVLFAIIGLPGRVSAAGTAVVSVAAPAQAVSSGTQFTVAITVQPNNAIAGVQFNLTFNPALVTVNSISEGNLLKQGGASTYFSAGQINNVAGTISGVSGAITTPGQSVSAQGTFAVITFTAGTTKGTTALNLSNVIVGDANEQALPVSVVNSQVSTDHPPVLTAIGARTVNEGAPLNFTISATDPDGDALTYSASNLPAGASFSASTRSFAWTPGYTQAGSYPNVHFQVSDGSLTSFEDITITVGNANRPPVLTSIGARTANEGAPLSFTISATDPDGDALTYSASNLPAGASFSASTRSFAWTPGYTQAGSYPGVHFQVSDGSLTAFEDITITVGNANRPPVLTSIGARTVNEGAPLNFTISATDPDGDALTYSASNLPAGASFSASTRSFAWTPGYTQAGSYPNVHFQVSDGSLTAFEDITITVGNANRPPVLTSIGARTVNEGAPLNFTISATDPDGDALTYSASNLPAGASFSASTRSFAWTPGYTQAGSYPNVHFQVSDGSLTAFEDITITVIRQYSAWDPTADGAVNVLDMISVGQHWGETGIAGWIRQDVNADGEINVLDQIGIGQHWTG